MTYKSIIFQWNTSSWMAITFQNSLHFTNVTSIISNRNGRFLVGTFVQKANYGYHFFLFILFPPNSLLFFLFPFSSISTTSSFFCILHHVNTVKNKLSTKNLRVPLRNFSALRAKIFIKSVIARLWFTLFSETDRWAVPTLSCSQLALFGSSSVRSLIHLFRLFKHWTLNTS